MKLGMLCAGIGLLLAGTGVAHADDAAELARMRRELDDIRTNYETRIRALEARIERLQAASAPAQPTQASPQPAQAIAQPTPVPSPPVSLQPQPVPAAAPPPTAAAAARPASRPTGENAFNPAISLILSGLYTRTSLDPGTYSITGFPMPADAEIGPGERSFSLAETELGLSGNIDPYLRGVLRLAIAPDNSVGVEEAYIQTLSLSHGFTARAGRFLSGIGYLNERHPHTWDFVDSPLAYQAFLGSQYGDDGLQLRWLAPTDTFVELGAEVGRGHAYPGTGPRGNGAGSTAVYAHLGGDIGFSHSWRAGLSLLQTSPRDQVTVVPGEGDEPVSSSFSGRNRVAIADFVWKWAPDGNPSRRNFKLQGEYLRRQQSGDVVYALDGPATPLDFSGSDSGWYLQGVYQFMPRWRVGLRAEQLAGGGRSFEGSGIRVAGPDYSPSRASLMVDFSPSEFSRFRVQLTRDRSREGAADNQLFLQYQTSLGAHGAHQF